MTITGFNNSARGALVVAHPSHELRVHGWLQIARPHVFVLTDGSGRDGQARLPSTTKVLEDTGAPQGSIYGRFTDLQVYDALLRGDFELFKQLSADLAEAFFRAEIEYVVADSAEGYSTTHDACRLVTDAAVEILKRKHKRQIASYDFLVVGPPDECPPAVAGEAIWLNLEDHAFFRKVSAARAYNPKLAADIDLALAGETFKGVKRFSQPQVAGEVDEAITAEVELAVRANPATAAQVKGVLDGVELHRFRIECLRPAPAKSWNRDGISAVPFYELYGEKMVAAGHYQNPIRYKDHFLPIAEAVWQYVEAHQ